MNTNSDALDSQQPDRRQDHALRGLFPEAVDKIHRLFHDQDDWAGTSRDFLALRLIHEQYPSLASAEVRRLVTAIGRRFSQPGRFDHLIA